MGTAMNVSRTQAVTVTTRPPVSVRRSEHRPRDAGANPHAPVYVPLTLPGGESAKRAGGLTDLPHRTTSVYTGRFHSWNYTPSVQWRRMF